MQRWVWIPECLTVVARSFVDFYGFLGCGSRGLRVFWGVGCCWAVGWSSDGGTVVVSSWWV